ncbi:MAG TPA: AMP-binding protein, partial [Thermoanaerobaculia bacterium]|nr:AMP-binding protein [Thermoanaerobaculia bacterium]
MSPEPTLFDVLLSRRGDDRPDSGRHFYQAATDSFRHSSYSQLIGVAFGLSHLLKAEGVAGRDPCVVCCRSLPAVLVGFYGALARGALPVVVPAPKSFQGSQATTDRLAALRAKLGDRAALLVEAGLIDDEGVEATRQWRTIVLPADPIEAELEPPADSFRPGAEDLAYLQETSASTGSGKLVAISHRNLRTALEAIRLGSSASDDETVVCWLPLYHDMGLVGCELFSLWWGYPLYLLTPFDFLKRPLRWLNTLSRYRGTMSPAPDFGYRYCAQAGSAADLEGLDLSRWRVAFSGAEPLHLSTVQKFLDRFEPHGFEARALLPCYGLAEATLAATFVGATELPKYACVERVPSGFGSTVPVRGTYDVRDRSPEAAPRPGEVAAFSVGRPVPRIEIELVDEAGRALPGEDLLGEIRVRGAPVARGYVAASGEGVEPFEDGVLTGDLGFQHGGELYVLERLKNVVIRHGENHLASNLEERLA